MKDFPCRNNILGEIKKCLNSVYEICYEDFMRAFEEKLFTFGE